MARSPRFWLSKRMERETDQPLVGRTRDRQTLPKVHSVCQPVFFRPLRILTRPLRVGLAGGRELDGQSLHSRVFLQHSHGPTDFANVSGHPLSIRHGSQYRKYLTPFVNQA